MIGYIGTYTQEKSKGIYSFQLDSKTGTLSGGDLIERYLLLPLASSISMTQMKPKVKYILWLSLTRHN